MKRPWKRNNDTLFVLIGFPGTGKSELCKYMEDNYGIKRLKTYSSRPPKYTDYDKYHLVSEERFDSMAKAGDLSLIRYLDVPTTGVYLNHVYRYGTATKDLVSGGVIILNWEGYTDILSVRSSNVVGIILDIEDPEDIYDSIKGDDDSLLAHLSANSQYYLAIQDNKELLNKEFIRKVAVNDRLYVLDSSLPEDELHYYVDLIIKEN